MSCLDQKEGTPENQVRFVCYTLQDNPADKGKAGASGSAVLASVEFEPAGTGSSSLELGDVKVLDVSGTALVVQTENATINVKGNGAGQNWMLWAGVGAIAVVAALAAMTVIVIRRRRSIHVPA